MAVAAVFTGMLGLALGSFLNVVIHRLPRGMSLARPRSACPRCGTPVRPGDNVPVLSWFLLRGRCRGCAEPISFRYPAVEALTALLCVVVFLVKGDGWELWPGLALVLLMVPVAFIDLDLHIIPNRLMAIGAVLAVGLTAALSPGDLVEHLVAGAAAGGLLLVAAIVRPDGMGMGDVKLAGVMGLFLGLAVIPAMFAAFVLGSLAGVVVMLRTEPGERRGKGIPFGPSLAAGAVLALLAGEPLVRWYAETFV
jgi:leader peptidase (prepilin peptidase)/N-methyltransferase